MSSISRRAVLALSAVASLAYLVFPSWAPLPLEVLLKGFSVTLLALAAWLAGRRLLAIALLFSSFGDVLLACDNRFFLFGLVAFLCAHLVYIAIFVRRGARVTAAPSRFAFPVVLLVYGFAFGAWLAPSLGALRVPVFCYIAAMLTMVAAANRAKYPSRLVVLGAVLFLISDSLLGADRFKTRIPLAGVLVWTTYYVGQFAITWGVLSGLAYAPTARIERAG